MDVQVYYRGAMNKLHQITASDVEHPNDALDAVREELEGDPFAQKPVLGLIIGGQQA